MKGHKDEYTVSGMARLLGVSRQAYYKWAKYGFSHRQEEADESLRETLKAICVTKHHYRYGRLRVEQDLREDYGLKVNHKRVARLLRKFGYNAQFHHKFRATTNSNHNLPVCPNILNRDFQAAGPGEKWVSDLTYLWTTGGWLYLTVILDLYDRKVIGWAFSTTMDAKATVIPALLMAFMNRQPKPYLLFHSDRGIQYCCKAFRDKLLSLCPTVRQSMSRKGNCWDNACAESFFKTLKRELATLDGKESRALVRVSVFEYLETYYNRVRRHSALDYLAPNAVPFRKLA
jgi:transposase InsO family protein